MGVKLRDYFKENDLVPTIYVNYNLGTGLNRDKIETAITGAGYALPTTEILFYIADTTKAFLVRYFPPLDKYGIEKLSMK
jgi:hypothetical protein